MFQFFEGAQGVSLKQGKSHVAKNVAAIPALRDFPILPSGFLQSGLIVRFSHKIDGCVVFFKAGVIHCPIRPDDGHEKRVAIE